MLRERSRAVTPTKRLASDERGSETSGNTDGHTTDTDTRDDQSERSTQSSGSKTARSNTGAASSGTKRRRKQDALLLSDQSVTLAQLLTHPSVIERRRARTVRRVSRLLTAESLAQRTARSRFVSKDERAVQKYCDHMTRSACYEARAARFRAGNLKVIEPPCTKLHYVRIVQRHTNDLLGDCTWLNQCFNMRSCPYVITMIFLITMISVFFISISTYFLLFLLLLIVSNRYIIVWMREIWRLLVPTTQQTMARLVRINKHRRATTKQHDTLPLCVERRATTHHCLIQLSPSTRNGSIAMYAHFRSKCSASLASLWPIRLGNSRHAI